MARISRFSPNWSDPEDLEAITVAREPLIAGAVDAVRASALTKNKHHLLFIGPRGSGKTHLITLVHHRLAQMDDVRDRLRIAWLNEDETSDSLLALLLRIHQALAKQYPAEFPARSTEAIYDLTEKSTATEAISVLLLEQLGERTLLLIVENLDALFREFGDGEQQRWRALIQNHPQFCTLATAQRLFDGVASRAAPFFGFFQVEQLNPFTVGEAIEHLAKIAKTNAADELAQFIVSTTGKARIRALHHLTGGNQRLFIILSEFIDRASLDSLVEPFEELVDEQLTPYYQERLRWLPTMQRRIVEHLCSVSKPASVKAIARHLFATPQTVSSQLVDLRKSGYVTAKKRGRESLYELAEPLMRISYQVKEANGRAPLRLLVDFLRVWYDHDQLTARLNSTTPEMAVTRMYLREACALSETEGSLRLQYFLEDAEGLNLASCDSNQLGLLRDLAEESNDPRHLVNYGVAQGCGGDAENAASTFTAVIEMDAAPSEGIAKALLNRGFTHRLRENSEAEIADFTAVIEMNAAPPELIAKALVYRGVTHGLRENSEAAITDYTAVIEMDAAPPELIAKALLNRGFTHGLRGDREAAITDYTAVIEMDTAPAEQKSRAHVALFDIFPQHGDWNVALSHLQSAFSLSVDAGARYLGDVRGCIQSILTSGQSRETWLPKADPLLSLFAKHGALTEFGSALVDSVAALRGSALSPEGLGDWHGMWAEFAQTYPELEIPARLLRTGIDYFVGGEEETVLLDLPSEERRILEQALGLE